jgi:adenosylmethionine-8-amino-7-oxononanoate aminotransferase
MSMLAQTAVAARRSGQVALRTNSTAFRSQATAVAPCLAYSRHATGVNMQYIPDTKPRVAPPVYDNSSGTPSASHWDEAWSKEQLQAAAENNAMNTWGPSRPVGSAITVDRGEGVYVYDTNGNKYLDWTSQAVCSNLGHTVPPAVRDAINGQLDRMPMVYGGIGVTEIRLRLANLMSEICPGDINGFLFPCGGGEANEAAIRIARRYTGKHKIFNQYRSYHGGTTSTLAATGDFRRWYAEAGASGFVKMFNSQPFGLRWGSSDEEKTKLLLDMLDEQIRMEGPDTIAAIMMESIVGAGGVLVTPKGYMEGVRALCDKYNILLILDEVMVGFGRTGKFWGFQHFDGVIPDILTSAKGLSAAYMPIAVLGMRQKIKDHFMDRPLGWGATFANHPVAMACAYECVKHTLKHDLAGNAKKLEPVMVEEMEKLVSKHSSVRQARAIGLFGCLDLVGADGNFIQEYQQAPSAKTMEFRKSMFANGLWGLFRPPLLHCAPPLVINEEELRDGFARLDKALDTLDA